jgi:transcriptional regulator with XRE-family HTH domain
MDAAQRFGLNLRIARRLKQMTQAELASQVYLDRCAISRMETGNRYPRLDHVLEFADALDVKPSVLLHGVA